MLAVADISYPGYSDTSPCTISQTRPEIDTVHFFWQFLIDVRSAPIGLYLYTTSAEGSRIAEGGCIRRIKIALLVSCCRGGRSEKPFTEIGSLRDPESGQLLFRLSEGGIHDAETRGGKQRSRTASLFHCLHACRGRHVHKTCIIFA
jgi:hypothetical protein